MTKVDHRYVFLDNQRLEKSVEYVSARSLYGSGIFTTLAVYDAEPFLWEKHWRRLVENATRTGIDLSEFSEDTTRNKLTDLVEANEARNGRVRITFFDESVSELWRVGSERRTSLLIISADFRPLPGAVRLTVSPYRVNSASPLAGVKSCNYLEKMLARSEGKLIGFDEAVQLNERGQIASACMANIFWK